MNPQTQKSPTGNPLLDYLLNQQQNPGAQTSQALQTLMSNPALSKAYSDRSNYYNSTNQDIASTIDSQNKNGVNGFAVNTSPGFQGLASSLPQNQAMTNSFLSNLVNQAQGGVNNNTNAGVTASGDILNAETIQRGQNLQYMGTPGDTTTSTGSNPRVDNWAQSVMNGYKSINDVPGDISPLVMKQLATKGYDPAKELWGDVNSLQSQYNQGNSLATGNNLGSKVGMGLSDLLNFATFGGAKTPQEQQKQNYDAATKNFTKKYAGILGANIDLPSVGDTPQQAQKKFTKLSEAIRNKFYQGGNPPGVGANKNDPLNLGL